MWVSIPVPWILGPLSALFFVRAFEPHKGTFRPVAAREASVERWHPKNLGVHQDLPPTRVGAQEPVTTLGPRFPPLLWGELYITPISFEGQILQGGTPAKNQLLYKWSEILLGCPEKLVNGQ